MPGLTFWPCPGVARFGGPHALAEQGDLIGVFLPAHLRQGADDRGGVGVARPIVDAQAAVGGVDVLQQRQLTRPPARSLAVVPGHHDAFLDVGLLDRLGQAIVVQQSAWPS